MFRFLPLVGRFVSMVFPTFTFKNKIIIKKITKDDKFSKTNKLLGNTSRDCKVSNVTKWEKLQKLRRKLRLKLLRSRNSTKMSKALSRGCKCEFQSLAVFPSSNLDVLPNNKTQDVSKNKANRGKNIHVLNTKIILQCPILKLSLSVTPPLLPSCTRRDRKELE